MDEKTRNCSVTFPRVYSWPTILILPLLIKVEVGNKKIPTWYNFFFKVFPLITLMSPFVVFLFFTESRLCASSCKNKADEAISFLMTNKISVLRDEKWLRDLMAPLLLFFPSFIKLHLCIVSYKTEMRQQFGFYCSCFLYVLLLLFFFTVVSPFMSWSIITTCAPVVIRHCKTRMLLLYFLMKQNNKNFYVTRLRNGYL